MAAVSVEIAEAVTAYLNSLNLSQSFEAVDSYADWESSLEDTGLHVDVVAVTTEQKAELASRAALRYTVPVDIGVRKKLDASDQDDDTSRIKKDRIDALVLLVQEIFEAFTQRRLTENLSGIWQETQILVCPIREHLHRMRQFTGIVRITFRYDKAIS